MRHGVSGKKLNRRVNERNALFRNLVGALIVHERIETTQARAKAVRGLVDRVIRDAKDSNLATRRKTAAWLPGGQAVRKLFEVMVPRYQDRVSGFSRSYRLGTRRGDRAPIVLMEMVDKDVYPEEVKSSPSAALRKGKQKAERKSGEPKEEKAETGTKPVRKTRTHRVKAKAKEDEKTSG